MTSRNHIRRITAQRQLQLAVNNFRAELAFAIMPRCGTKALQKRMDYERAFAEAAVLAIEDRFVKKYMDQMTIFKNFPDEMPSPNRILTELIRNPES